MDGANEVRMVIDIHGRGEDNEQSTAWRQQTIFASEFVDISMDLMEHRRMQFNLADAYLQYIKPIKNAALLKLRFPNVEDSDCSYSIESEDMFERPLRNYEEPVTAGGRPRYTMDNFLNGKGPSKKLDNEEYNTVKDLNPVTNRDRNEFYTAREVLALQTTKNIANNPEVAYPKSEGNVNDMQTRDFSFGATKKKLGSLGRISNTNKKSFVPPVRGISASIKDNELVSDDTVVDLSHAALKNIDSKMVEVINNEIMHQFKPVDWGEIAGLVYAKSIIKEAVVYPFLRPDLFTGLRRPPRGILLFGPPGTGKTLIGKCIASQSKSTFFSISSASLTSKWMGEGEKMVRALFAVAVARQPSVIFMDEIDSLLAKRSENEHEGTRRLKTEFLVRLDGAATSEDDRVLIVGATNRPQELDDAVRRRFVKRLYVPLPELDARIEILTNLLTTVDNNLNLQDLTEIAKLSEGYSGADMDSLCREASMEPLRSLSPTSILTFSKDNLRPVNKNDFYSALKKIRPSVSKNDLDQYVEWNKTYGSSY